MELYQEILAKILEKEEVQVTFPNIDTVKIAESECYKALKKIKEIIELDSFSDKECFMRIELIVRLFEELGSGGGGRHDF